MPSAMASTDSSRPRQSSLIGVSAREMPGASPLGCESTCGVCCNPTPTTSSGHSCSPKCIECSAFMLLGWMLWSSSTINTNALPSQAVVRFDARSRAGNSPVCRPCSRVAPAVTVAAPSLPLTTLVSSSATCRNSVSAPNAVPMAMNRLTSKASSCGSTTSVRVAPLLRASTSLANRSANWVLPTPGTPVTSAMPLLALPRSRTNASRRCSAVNSVCRPAKCGGGPRSVSSAKSLCGSWSNVGTLRCVGQQRLLMQHLRFA